MAADVTTLLVRWKDGDAGALDELTPLIYSELKSLAHAYLSREGVNRTLQTTELAHEAFLRLVDVDRIEWKGRTHFYGIAALMIRRILVDRARARRNSKHGGELQRVELKVDAPSGSERGVDVLLLDEALEKLGEFDPQMAKLVELRFFGGLGIEETGDVLRLSPATVKRYWVAARAWLARELAP
jgi:RNA polymerase sigma factor (TIGR02999 family)